MIQLVFDASTPAQALERAPVEVGYSQHEGAERAAWGDDKLERVDGTHPVVHPAAGSHANFYGEALYLGSSAEQGVGCDDTRGPTFDVRPAVQTIPSDPRAGAARTFPWIAFEGRWGELQPAFFNGPTGPNLKTQWTEPIRWSEGWRDRSYTVPGGSAFGTGATDFFCGAVGQRLARARPARRPAARRSASCSRGSSCSWSSCISRATWRPDRSAPPRTPPGLGPDPRRPPRACTSSGSPSSSGSVSCSCRSRCSSRCCRRSSCTRPSVLGVQTGGESNGLLALLVLAIGTALTLLGLGLVQAATRAGAGRDRRGPAGRALSRAYRLAARQRRAAASERCSWSRRRRLAARELDLPDPDRGVAGRPLGADRARRSSSRTLSAVGGACAAAAGSCGGAGSRSRR